MTDLPVPDDAKSANNAYEFARFSIMQDLRLAMPEFRFPKSGSLDDHLVAIVRRWFATGGPFETDGLHEVLTYGRKRTAKLFGEEITRQAYLQLARILSAKALP